MILAAFELSRDVYELNNAIKFWCRLGRSNHFPNNKPSTAQRQRLESISTNDLPCSNNGAPRSALCIVRQGVRNLRPFCVEIDLPAERCALFLRIEPRHSRTNKTHVVLFASRKHRLGAPRDKKQWPFPAPLCVPFLVGARERAEMSYFLGGKNHYLHVLLCLIL